MLEAIKGHYKNGKVELYEKPHLKESDVIITFLNSEESKPVDLQAKVSTKKEGVIQPKKTTEAKDPVLRLQGLGKDIWKGVDPDGYVKGLREGWE